MKKAKKILVMVAALALTAALAIGGTLAYLTSTTETVKNTFTVGNVKITLDEADVKVDGTYETNKDSRVIENEYHLLPGHEYIKDPTIHVDAKSEDCYLFVKITDEIVDIQDATTVADQMTAKGWTAVDGVAGVYSYKDIAKAGDNVVVFENFKILGTVKNDALAAYAGKTITVQGYAVQADGFAGQTPAQIWTAAFGA